MFQHFKRTVNGTSTEVYTLVMHVDNFKVGSLGSNSVYTSSLQGVNGTFYGSTMLGIAVQNGAAVRPSSSWNLACLKNGSSTVDRNRGTMYRTTGGTVAVKKTVLAQNLTGALSSLRWAIGGISLLLDQTLTSASYNSAIASEAEGVGGVSDKRPRTLMGYIPSSQEIVLAIAVDAADPGNPNKGITMFDGRTIMKDLGCTMGIHLDGGSSTSIRLRHQPQDGAEQVVRHRVTTNAQLVAAYFDTTWPQQRFPSPWTDL
ncbi:hypothetical protein C0Q44_28280 [Paenibacillus sp. PCH8]|uniref:phosphodiester glycosidase family protein n=1 Tax=Paenibacillus sp. PCH8 TaxID=2066524 RepID=UPI000CFA4863|nr:phosphodiester glycosidase family protein [Paenibacillus sp. PCH8]PQP80314.1 hypothetical protein C0Q44_28280 [Paenibacillus sp. PCH8]